MRGEGNGGGTWEGIGPGFAEGLRVGDGHRFGGDFCYDRIEGLKGTIMECEKGREIGWGQLENDVAYGDGVLNERCGIHR